jgi:hypothetical protein
MKSKSWMHWVGRLVHWPIDWSSLEQKCFIQTTTFCWCKTVVRSQHSQPPAKQTWTKQNRSKTWQPCSGGFFSLFVSLRISQDSLTKLHGQRPIKDPIWRPSGSHRLLFPTFSGPNRVPRMCRFLDTIRLLLSSAFTRWQCQLTTWGCPYNPRCHFPFLCG